MRLQGTNFSMVNAWSYSELFHMQALIFFAKKLAYIILTNDRLFFCLGTQLYNMSEGSLPTNFTREDFVPLPDAGMALSIAQDLYNWMQDQVPGKCLCLVSHAAAVV